MIFDGVLWSNVCPKANHDAFAGRVLKPQLGDLTS